MFFDVPRQLPTSHPIRNELWWIDSDTEEGYNILVCKACQDYHLFAEDLWLSPVMVNRESDSIKNRTTVTFRNSSGSKIRVRLMQTFELPMAPWNVSPKPPAANGLGWISRRFDGIVHDVGSIIRLPHSLLSSCRHFLEA